MIYRAGEQPGARPPGHVTFGTRRRGLDPEQVYAYLRQVADERERLLRDLLTARSQVERMRQGLRQWQSRHAHCRPTRSDRP